MKMLAFFPSALIGAALLAGTLAPAPAAAENAVKAPDEIVRDAVTRVRTLIDENQTTYREDSEKYYAMIEEEIVPHFDVPYISRLVLGRHARGASSEQRGRFARAFKTTLIRSYADAMLEYSDNVEAVFDPFRMPDDADQVTVSTRLKPKDGQDIPIGFVMHKVDDSWLIFDVSVEGISLVTNFRAQFNQRIRADGLDKLIERLEGGEIEPELEG